MFSKFLNLNPEKQERILNAAINEFAQKGYENASTNQIVKEANISKGLLFHYFNNKKGLFLFMYDYSLELIMEEFYAKIDLNERDILIKWKQIVLLKFELVKKYPEMFNFFRAAYDEDSAELKKDLERRNKETMSNSYSKLFKDIDASKFKQGIDINRAINIIIWTMEGFGNLQQEKAKLLSLNQINMEEVLTEMDLYLETLKESFYK